MKNGEMKQSNKLLEDIAGSTEEVSSRKSIS